MKKYQKQIITIASVAACIAILILMRDPAQPPTSAAPAIQNARGTRYYLGLSNMTRYSSDINHLREGEWGVSGSWTQDATNLISVGDDALLSFRVTAKKVYIYAGVVEKNSFATIDASVNGAPKAELTISTDAAYSVLSANTTQDNVLIELHVPSGIKLSGYTIEL